jgi:hypothetical protein
MATVAELIEAARMEDPSFTPRRHTHHVLRRTLAPYIRSLAGKVAHLAPNDVAEEYVVELPLEDFYTGHELVEEVPDPEDPEELMEIPLRYIRMLNTGQAEVRQADPIEFRLMGQGARWGPHRTPVGWFRQGRLYLAGEPADWKAILRIKLYYVPVPETDLELDDEPFLGTLAEGCYTAWLALRMASRAGRSEISRPLADFRGELEEREHNLLMDMANRHAVSDRIREVW